MRNWKNHLTGLVVFRDILEDEVILKMQNILNLEVCDTELISAIASFQSVLFEHGTSWTKYLLNTILESENIYISNMLNNKSNKILEDCLQTELHFLQELGSLTLKNYLETTYGPSESEILSFLPQWETEEIDFSEIYLERVSQINKKGYGIFAKYSVFVIKDSDIIPVKYPDNQKLSDLSEYELERNRIIANTKALLLNKPANNVLLVGDAGTGKSSTVKAIVNEFCNEGLRLIEVKKNQLYQIPDIIEQLNKNPLKFILFIDDLSFTSNDDNFAALKAILEGSVCRRSNNVVVYATSNRRHLIKETWSEREGDDIHINDTRQELMSLSDRFGLSITFQKPNKDKFANIVIALSQKYNILDTTENIIAKAERFALNAGGRSPRVAKQFIELYNAGIE